MSEIPKIFISYSWTTPSHEAWVINLAQRLVSDGIDVILDKWDLKEGQDKYNFMETMVSSPDITKVLIILDKGYLEKSNKRRGGVGTEAQIISPKVYANVSQEKFIPIIAEKDENGNPYVPTYLESRIYIDLSEQNDFESNYESLLRNIHKRPAHSKPMLGKAPSYLFEDSTSNFKTSYILRSLDNQIEKNPKRLNSTIKDFLEEFYLSLQEFTITFSNRSDIKIIGKEICDNIHSYTPLRNDFIHFFDKVLKSEYDFDIVILIRFLERLPILTKEQDGRGSWRYELDNFKFFTHELFLYLITIGLKNENYKFIEEIIYSSYFFQNSSKQKLETETFALFYFNIGNLLKPYYTETYSKQYLSPVAELIIKRIPIGYTKTNLTNADLLCHYLGQLNNINWFPLTYIYGLYENFDFIERLISQRHFERVKALLNVSTPTELKDKLISIRESDTNPRKYSFPDTYESVVAIYYKIDIDKIASIR